MCRYDAVKKFSGYASFYFPCQSISGHCGVQRALQTSHSMKLFFRLCDHGGGVGFHLMWFYHAGLWQTAWRQPQVNVMGLFLCVRFCRCSQVFDSFLDQDHDWQMSHFVAHYTNVLILFLCVHFCCCAQIFDVFLDQDHGWLMRYFVVRYTQYQASTDDSTHQDDLAYVAYLIRDY